MLDWLKEKGGNAWDGLTGWIGDKTENFTGIDFDGDGKVGDTGKKAEEFSISNLFNLKTAGAAAGGLGAAFFGSKLLKGLFSGGEDKGFLRSILTGGPIGFLMRTVATIAIGAIAFFGIKSLLSKGDKPDIADKDPKKEQVENQAQAAQQNRQVQKTPEEIKNGLNAIFADNMVKPEEVAELKSLLDEHKKADAAGYQQYVTGIKANNPALARELGLG